MEKAIPDGASFFIPALMSASTQEQRLGPL